MEAGEAREAQGGVGVGEVDGEEEGDRAVAAAAGERAEATGWIEERGRGGSGLAQENGEGDLARSGAPPRDELRVDGAGRGSDGEEAERRRHGR